MNFKKVFFLFILICLPFWYAIVNSDFYKSIDVKVFDVMSENIYLNSSDLNSTIIAFQSKTDLSNFKIQSSCNIESNFLEWKQDYYFFSLKVKDNDCSNSNFYLKNNNKIFTNTLFSLNLIKDYDLLNLYTDYNNLYLQNFTKKTSETKEKFKIFSTYEWDFNYDFLKKKRYFYELDHKEKLINNIILKRESKYEIPVEWHKLPTLKTKLPNSPRPYRAEYTDWIHEWWDIDAPFWTEVVALDDWIIVNVINGFKYSDLDSLKLWKSLTYEDKIINLNTLRWNQVWVKTMKWDVVFYWHLNEIYDDVKVWDFVTRWTPLWKVWKTWVPDENYKDFHLHFEVRKNPYNNKNAWKYSLLDYMKWEWYFKWKDENYIKQNQYNIFDK